MTFLHRTSKLLCPRRLMIYRNVSLKKNPQINSKRHFFCLRYCGKMGQLFRNTCSLANQATIEEVRKKSRKRIHTVLPRGNPGEQGRSFPGRFTPRECESSRGNYLGFEHKSKKKANTGNHAPSFLRIAPGGPLSSSCGGVCASSDR